MEPLLGDTQGALEPDPYGTDVQFFSDHSDVERLRHDGLLRWNPVVSRGSDKSVEEGDRRCPVAGQDASLW